MKFFYTLLLIVMTTPALAVDLRKLTHQVDNAVARIKGEDSDAVEYRKARTIHFIDIDGDGEQDAIVFFTIEGRAGGNNYDQYLTALKGQSSDLLLLDTVLVWGGAMGGASYERPAVKEKRITIQRTEYAVEDSRCCPSIKSSVTLVLQGTKLVEVSKPK